MEKIFAQHIYFERPKEGRPDFIKGRISIKVEDFKKWVDTLEKSEKGYVYMDLKVSKEKKELYLEVDTWKPEKKAEQLDESSIPF